MQILPIFAKHKWGGGAPEGRDGGVSALSEQPLRQSLRDCHLPIWLRKMERNK